MIDRRWARILASLSLVAVAPMAAAGQALCDLAVRAGTKAPTTWPVPLDRSVTIRLTNTSLRDALDRVAAQARIRLFYSRDLLPSDRPVCIDYVGAPAGQVLVELLAGSDLEAVALGSDQVVVSRRATSAIRTADSVVRVQ